MPTLTNSLRMVATALVLGCLALPGQARLTPGFPLTKRVDQLLSDVYTTETGLPSNSIRDILHSQSGYLYLATANGLARFDGRTFTNFTKSAVQELRNNDIAAVTEDTDGRIWIATLGAGVTAWERGRFTNYGKAQGLTNEMVNALAYDVATKSLFVGTNAGLFRLVEGKYVQTGVPAPLDKVEISVLRLGADGTLWVGTKLQGLYAMRQGRLDLHLDETNGLGHNYVRSLSQPDAQGIWVGTNGAGLVRVEGGQASQTLDAKRNGLSNDNIQNIVVDGQGSIWLATPAGVSRVLPDGSVQIYNTSLGLSYNTVLAVHLDREGSLWIGTSRGGLNRLRDGLFTTYTEDNGLLANTVHAVLPDANNPGAYYLATDGGMNYLANGKVQPAEGLDALRGELRVRGVFQDAKGRLWASTYKGLFLYENKRLRRFGEADGLASELNRFVFEDSRGTTWIGTRYGLSRMVSEGRFENFKTSPIEALANGTIHHMLEDRQGNLWISTDGNGLVQLPQGDVARAKVYTIADGLGSDVVYKLFLDPQNVLWVGTNGGVSRFKDNAFVTVSTEHGLKSNSAFQLLPDSKGNFWITTDLGITVVKREDLLAASEGTLQTLPIRQFTKAEGLRSNECTANGWAIRTPEGQMIIPTVAGLALINEETQVSQAYQPPVVVEAVSASGTELLPWGLDQLAIAANLRRSMDIGFTCLTFIASDKLEFQYRLEGFDDDWKPARADRTATYTNLPDGEYIFRVRARTPGGQWLPQTAVLTLDIQPQIYETLWFQLMLALALIGIGFLIYRWRVREYEHREQELKVKVAEATAGLREQQRQTEQANQQLEANNTQLTNLLENLKQTQNQLVHSEKLAALGTLLAGVAHEINTPLAAINAAAGSLGKTLQPTFHQLPELIKTLDPRTESLFFQLLDRSLQFSGSLTSREERQYKKTVAETLSQLQVANPDSLAGQLVKIGLFEHLDNYAPLLQHPRVNDLLELVSTIGRLRLNVDNIQLAVAKTQKIVFALKSYSHTQADDSPVEADIPETIETVLTIYHNQLKAGVNVTRHYPDRQHPIYCYPDELNQVWTNIIHNAIQAMSGQGELEITVEEKPGEIWASFTDNGPGIPADVMPKIFNAFFTTKAKGEGSGLGLDIVKRIVDKHQGRIDVASVPGRTTFTVIIPTTLEPRITPGQVAAAAMTQMLPN